MVEPRTVSGIEVFGQGLAIVGGLLAVVGLVGNYVAWRGDLQAAALTALVGGIALCAIGTLIIRVKSARSANQAPGRPDDAN